MLKLILRYLIGFVNTVEPIYHLNFIKAHLYSHRINHKMFFIKDSKVNKSNLNERRGFRVN